MFSPQNHGETGGLEIFPTMSYVCWNSVMSPAAAGNACFDLDVTLSEDAMTGWLFLGQAME